MYMLDPLYPECTLHMKSSNTMQLLSFIYTLVFFMLFTTTQWIYFMFDICDILHLLTIQWIRASGTKILVKLFF